MPSIDELLGIAVKQNASDLHLTVGLPPQLRIDGRLTPISNNPLTPEEVETLAYQMLNPSIRQRFEQTQELDTSYSIKGVSRFRVNIYKQRGSVSCAIRIIPFKIPSLEELGLPAIVKEFTTRPHGLFIVSGPTGSGKSTTLAAMIERINEERNGHIVTIEDPIEYLHQHRKAMIHQREVGIDTTSFEEALRHVVREDPNIVLIGEMRDRETMAAALTLAETGHLILTTLHTSDAANAIHRIVDIFPANQQLQIRIQLSMVLAGIMVQQLLPHASGKGRVVATEILVNTPSAGNLIRENQLHQLSSVIQTGGGVGMVTMNQSLAKHYEQGMVQWEEILRRSTDVEDLTNLIQAHQPRFDRH